MNHIKKTFVKILREKIYVDEKLIPVVIKDYPLDKTPCITISGYNRDKGKHRRQQVRVLRTLSEDHPLYDPKYPEKRYPHSAEYSIKSYEINIHVWCDTERERELIIDQIYDCLFYCMNFHYMFCERFDKKDKCCETTGQICEAITDKGYHGLRGQCPNKHNKPMNIMYKHGIIKNSVHISPHYEADILDKKAPLKHSVIEVPLDYKRIKVIKSNPTFKIINEI